MNGVRYTGKQINSSEKGSFFQEDVQGEDHAVRGESAGGLPAATGCGRVIVGAGRQLRNQVISP